MWICFVVDWYLGQSFGYRAYLHLDLCLHKRAVLITGPASTGGDALHYGKCGEGLIMWEFHVTKSSEGAVRHTLAFCDLKNKQDEIIKYSSLHIHIVVPQEHFFSLTNI